MTQCMYAPPTHTLTPQDQAEYNNPMLWLRLLTCYRATGQADLALAMYEDKVQAMDAQDPRCVRVERGLVCVGGGSGHWPLPRSGVCRLPNIHSPAGKI